MGVYNCSVTLPKAIESILNQTYPNIELIICDDCSSDDTFSVAKRYQAQNPDRICLIKNEKNLSLGPTLNRCLQYATGEYIARMDGDDYSAPDRLSKQLAFLKENPQYDLVGTNMMAFNNGGELGLRTIKSGEATKFDTVFGVPFCHATILAKRSVYDDLQGYSCNQNTWRVEDVDLWFRFFLAGKRGYNMNEALYYVREDGSEYRRRTFRNYRNATYVCLNGTRSLKLPLRYYIGSLFPIAKCLVPMWLIKLYRKNINSK